MNPLVCHDLKLVEQVDGEDAYRLQCSCGKWTKVDGLKLTITIAEAKDAERAAKSG